MRRFDVVFDEINFLLRIRLHVIRVNATRGSVNNFFDARLDRFPENDAVEKKIRGRSRLMQIHISAAAMIRGEMEYNFDPLHCGARYAGLAQIRFHESDAAILEVPLNVARACRW